MKPSEKLPEEDEQEEEPEPSGQWTCNLASFCPCLAHFMVVVPATDFLFPFSLFHLSSSFFPLPSSPFHFSSFLHFESLTSRHSFFFCSSSSHPRHHHDHQLLHGFFGLSGQRWAYYTFNRAHLLCGACSLLATFPDFQPFDAFDYFVMEEKRKAGEQG